MLRLVDPEPGMSKKKLLSVIPKSAHARRLQRLLLDYHHYRITRDSHPLTEAIDRLGKWQIKRLKNTYRHLYHEPRYHDALNFLLEDLYSPKQFVGRDTDLERIFPKMVKLVPDQTLGSVANLVELNLLTQKLDEHLATIINQTDQQQELTTDLYIRCFRDCNNLSARRHQLQLISTTGLQLEKYVRSHFLRFTLSLTAKPAEMAGLGQLHQFIIRGFEAFLAMGGINELLNQIIFRENEILERIFTGDSDPFR
jgi:predicted nucleic acid-binding OB-fold protein